MEDLLPWEKEYAEQKANRKLSKETVWILLFALALVSIPIWLVIS
jgi:hypothetical protein